MSDSVLSTLVGFERKVLSAEERSKLFSSQGSIPSRGTITLPSRELGPVPSAKTNIPLDAVDCEEESVDNPIRPASDYTPLDFKDCVDFITFFSPLIQNEQIKLHNWQRDIGGFLSQSWNKEAPLKFYLKAANGSGKDAYVLAAHAVFFAACKIRSRWVCTSSSYRQIHTQTEPYIRTLCTAVNNFFGDRVFILKKQHIICTITGSEILLYVSDDPDNIEGYHPFPDYPGAELAVVINEAKSVDDSVFHALRRCTGYSIWLEVSSPGKALGHFYESVTNARQWEEGYQTGKGYTRTITSYDCPHVSVASIEEDRTELPAWLFGSIHLALFSSIDEAVLIMPESIAKVVARMRSNNPIPWIRFGNLAVGIDAAAGGDENTILLRHGNKIVDKDYFVERDTTVTARRFYRKLKEWEKLGLREEFTYADDGGVGRAIFDQLADKEYGMGWVVNRVLNQSAPIDRKRYANRGAELWYNGAAIILGWYFIIDVTDEKMIKQLGNRYYKQGDTNGKIALESKVEAKSKGRPSPDRADGLMLSLTGVTVDDFKKAFADSNAVVKQSHFGDGGVKLADGEAVHEYMDNLAFGAFDAKPPNGRRLRPFISSILSRRGHKQLSQFNRGINI